MDAASPVEPGLRLTEAELDVFAALCAREVAPIYMENLARRIVDNFENFTKEKLSEQAEPTKALYRAILERLNEKETLTVIVERMFFEITWTEGSKPTVAGLTRSVRSAQGQQGALQAFMTQRDYFISNGKLATLFNEIVPCIGLIVGTFLDDRGGEQSTTGTIFLVGPDLVLTSNHVFKEVPPRVGVPENFKIVFDYFDGAQITGVADVRGRRDLLVVDLHPQNWDVANSKYLGWVGEVAVPDSVESDSLLKNLDYSLLRLDRSVGALPLRTDSRKLRGWLNVGPLTPMHPFAVETQVLMPQHPLGMPMRHAFGRITGQWGEPTRIIYNLNTANGTSGAPCLNADMEVIGLHTAAHRPNGLLEGNLAVRIDRICPEIAQYLGTVVPPALAQGVWRTARADRLLEPIVGRGRLQVWCDAALKDSINASRSRSDRVYAADTQSPRAGKTFTADILRTMLNGLKDHPVIVIGGDTSALPETAEEFISMLAAGIGMKDLSEMPPRPGVTLPQGAMDGDKLDRWLSQDLPNWLAGRLSIFRPVERNRSEAAKKLVDANTNLGRINTAEDISLANANPPVILREERWKKIWILLDDLDELPLSAEVRRLVASLIGADVDENAVADVRSTIQWLFLGRAPDFLLPADMAVETITADVVPVAAIQAFIAAALAAGGIAGVDAFSQAVPILGMAGGRMKDVPQTRLEACQALVALVIEGFYELNGLSL